MRTQTVDTFLQTLAARVPAPGGGATAALHAAQGAALIAMVARYTTGEKYAEHAAAVGRLLNTADALRTDALTLAEEDAAAFSAVSTAYGMPKSSTEDKAARSHAIAAALVGAGRVPARVVAVAAHVVDLAEQLRPISNPNVISDVAAAADAARAAASTARINVEINLSGITDTASRGELSDAIAHADEILLRADKITAAVREQILR